VAAVEATNIRIAAPFWGANAIKLLGLRPTRRVDQSPFKLICNLESGACNPAPIRSLQSDLKWETRTNRRLHAKVYIFPNCAIVGSANPSANGLALQDTEASSWHEVCSVHSNTGELRKLREWFDLLFENGESLPVTPSRLQLAETLWAQRRKDTGNILKRSGDGGSLKELAEGEQGMSIQENTWVWI
jgi:hypothetical protein